ncbi:MAG TPA: ABC transporter substrate-binding protein [bacterium]|nr:ABC transporter substrate-binding protein [bacterium]
MNKILTVAIALSFLAACAKKEGETPAPKPAEAPAAAAPSASAPAPSPETAPAPSSQETKSFVIPPAAKKQAKYFPEGTPSRAIQDLDDMLDSYYIDPQTPEQKKYNEDLKGAVIKGTFDIRELCRLALDKHWAERTPQEQDAFVDLMIRLLEKKAIFSKEQGQKKADKKKSKTVYQVTYEGDKPLTPDQTALAMSLVHIPSESLKIELNYKLKKESASGAWKIFDVIVDGASLLDNYKYQFDKIIGKEGYPNLIRRMESKLQELQQKDQPQK